MSCLSFAFLSKFVVFAFQICSTATDLLDSEATKTLEKLPSLIKEFDLPSS